MSKPGKIGLAIFCVVAGFVIAGAFIAPRVVHINRYRPEVISYIERQTSRRVEIGRLRLSVFPAVSIEVNQFALANPPGFPNGNWISVQRIDARLDVGALFKRQVVISALRLKSPVLDLYSGQEGSWNFQAMPPATRVRIPSNDPPPFVFREISNLLLTGGQVSIEKLLPNRGRGRPIVRCNGLAARFGHIEIPEWTTLPEASTLTSGTSGHVKPGLPVNAVSSSGTLTAAAIWFGNFLATHIAARVHAAPARVSFNGIHFDFYGGHASGNASLELPAGRYQTHVQMSGVNVGKLLAQVPALRGQMTGTMDGQITFSGEVAASSGPWTGKQGEGKFAVRNGRWPKLRLGQTILELTHLAQLGPASNDVSAFSSVSAGWKLDDGVMEISNLRAIGQGIRLDGSARVDLTAQDHLHFEGVAEIAARRNLLSSLLAGIAGGSFKGGKIELPIVVTGTLKQPVLQLTNGAQFPPPTGSKH
ncbi:MAG: AsmA family protein [Terriglobia bacterium]